MVVRASGFKLRTPCINGWDVYPDIQEDYYIEFGKKVNLYLPWAKSTDQRT